MKKIILQTAMAVAKPFLGKGIIDKHAPILLKTFAYGYARMQGDMVKTVSIPLDAKLAVYAKDIGIGLPLLLKGEYEPMETKLFLEEITPGNIILDIGANVGYYAVLASIKTGGTGKVFAFEVDPETTLLLEKNIALNDRQNVIIDKRAVCNSTGQLMFFSERFNKGETSINETKGKRSFTAQGITLDTFANEHQNLSIDIIKMDIEGAEILAMQGASSAFAKWKHLKLFIEYNPSAIIKSGSKPETLLMLLAQNNFIITHIIDESKHAILSYSKEMLIKTMTRTTYCNLFCVKI